MIARLLSRMLRPSHGEGAAFKQQGDALLKAGRLGEAEEAYRFAVARNPEDGRARFTLGYTLREQGRTVEAASQLQAALSIDPKLVDAHYVLGTIQAAGDETPAAIRSFEKALALDPLHVHAAADLRTACAAHARLLRERGRAEEALRCYERLVVLAPDSAQFHFDRGNLLQALQRHEEALESFVHVVGLAPEFDGAHALRCQLLLELGRSAEGLAACDAALRLHPGQPSLLNCRGIALHELRRPLEALASYDLALQAKPDYAAALTNRSTTLLVLNRFEEALRDLDRAEGLAPGLADVSYVRGNVLQEMTRHEEALRCYARALQLRPGFEEAHLNAGVSRLSLGDFERGWQDYEHRWKCPGWRISQPTAVRAFDAPLWLGSEPLEGKTILLHAEQGIGDTLQFSRYAPLLAEAGATVMLDVQPPLVEVLRDLQGVRSVHATGDLLPPYDYRCPLLSLPLACGTRLDSIPSPGPYLGNSERHREKVDQWRRTLGAKTRRRVGVAWSGNAGHRNDANRSIAFDAIKGLLSADLEFCCLQNELRVPERDAVLGHRGIRWFGEALSDFSETAGLIGNMDLVICVDTSVAHLAGALGAPIWLLLPANPDFRWLLGRDDSPWYASMRLIRQRRIGSWADELSALRRELDRLAASPLRPSPRA